MTDRQMDILGYLRKQKEYVTVLQISNVIQMSVQTTRNELNIIHDYMNQTGLGMIDKKPRRGIKLIIDEDSWKQLLYQTDEIRLDGHFSDIKNQIIYLLMIKDSLSLAYIKKNLYAGRSSVERLIPDIMTWFKSHNIIFEKKKGKGWRIAMWDIFL